MVKKIMKFFAYLIFFIAALIYFSPKTNMYYLLEQELKKFSVIVSSEEISDNGFTLSVENANLSVQSIESAKISELNMGVFLIYNSVEVNDIVLSGMAESFIPVKIKSVNISHSIFSPLNASIEAIGDFGKAKGSFNILENSLSMKVIPSKMMSTKYKNTLRTFKKDKNGEYRYDKTF